MGVRLVRVVCVHLGQKDYDYDETLQIGFGDTYTEYIEQRRDTFRQV